MNKILKEILSILCMVIPGLFLLIYSFMEIIVGDNFLMVFGLLASLMLILMGSNQSLINSIRFISLSCPGFLLLIFSIMKFIENIIDPNFILFMSIIGVAISSIPILIGLNKWDFFYYFLLLFFVLFLFAGLYFMNSIGFKTLISIFLFIGLLAIALVHLYETKGSNKRSSCLFHK